MATYFFLCESKQGRTKGSYKKVDWIILRNGIIHGTFRHIRSGFSHMRENYAHLHYMRKPLIFNVLCLLYLQATRYRSWMSVGSYKDINNIGTDQECRLVQIGEHKNVGTDRGLTSR